MTAIGFRKIYLSFYGNSFSFGLVIGISSPYCIIVNISISSFSFGLLISLTIGTGKSV